MVTLQPSVLCLRAADVMSRDVLAIPQEMSLRYAARLLSRARVSGAPVVDDLGCCVGVLSSTDFMHWTEQGSRGPAGKTGLNDCICSEWQLVDYRDLPADQVRHYMTADPVTVRPATPIRELARLMLDAHIHRLIVVDEFCKPVGVVSSTDLLAALARAEE
jgi:CBS-domain-containing membrane protein